MCAGESQEQGEGGVGGAEGMENKKEFAYTTACLVKGKIDNY